MSESAASERTARAAAIERRLAQGETIHPDEIAELLASGDEELALLGSHLALGQEELVMASAATTPAAMERLTRQHDAPEHATVQAAALPAAPTDQMTILVHGAFAAGDTWWRPTGDFGRYVQQKTGNLYGGADFYRWSGGGFHPDRVAAAGDLLEWVENHPAGQLDVISHSHGGNIVFLATQMGLKIRKHISLATPICLDYFPDLRNVGILHNVISLADIIQGPASYIGVSHRGDGRTLADSARVINHLATRDGGGNSPSHSELHDPATWRASNLEARLLGPGSLPG